MSLTLNDVRRIAGDVAHEVNPRLDVVAAMPVGRDSTNFADVMLMLRGCRRHPCRMVVGFSRGQSEAECRAAVRARLHEHLAGHGGNEAIERSNSLQVGD
jgi:hypothetical protein